MTGIDEIRPPSTLPAFLTLFTSTGTLICCALPALLVSLGAGAVMAGLIEAVPQITWLGKNKTLVFALAGALLLTSGAWQWHARSLPCPADKAQAAACARARKLSWIVWGLSVALYAIGAFFAFFAASLFY
ncbi:hypothetical protein ACQKH5_04540 [Hyphomonas sp. NPDC076900]|uniref:hypothetical protein n=1 Tax=unclassified Hyphomonas TaxID=2630699 RepID=UPI003D02D30C